VGRTGWKPLAGPVGCRSAAMFRNESGNMRGRHEPFSLLTLCVESCN
jgi:hypothetical protein